MDVSNICSFLVGAGEREEDGRRGRFLVKQEGPGGGGAIRGGTREDVCGEGGRAKYLFNPRQDSYCKVQIIQNSQDWGQCYEFQCEPQSRNRQIINLRKKWGFRQFQKERLKVCRTALFAHFLRTKCGFLADVSDIFYFFLLGEGKGESEAAGRGAVRYFIDNPRRGGGSPGGAKGPGGCLRRIGDLGGGGLNIFVRGRNVHQGFARF